MARIDRYMLSQFMVFFGFFSLVLILVYWINRAVVLFDQLIADGQSATVFLEFTALSLPNIIRIVLPLAAFAASLYVTNRMTAESELIVVQATGYSAFRLARPALYFGLIVTGLMLVLTHVLAPISVRHLNIRQAEIAQNATARLLREGQFLIIPVSAAGAPLRQVAIAETAPGVGSPTPVPPSASEPLPDEDVAPAAQKAKETPVSPDLGEQRSTASAAKFVMPVDGKIIRAYSKGKNDGIDISAGAGTAVKAAADGVIAAITKDTEQVPILVIRHAGGLLTVYAGLDGIKVAKGAKVKRGQTIAAVRAGNPAFVHFEVRKGVDSVDPVQFLQ